LPQLRKLGWHPTSRFKEGKLAQFAQ